MLGPPIADYVRSLTDEHVMVLIGEMQPARLWERILKNRRGTVVGRYVGRTTKAVVCRLTFRLGRKPEPATYPRMPISKSLYIRH